MRTLVKIILAVLLLTLSTGPSMAAEPREQIELACREYVLQQLDWEANDLEIVFHTYLVPDLEWTGVTLQVSHPRNADLCGVVALKAAVVKQHDTLRTFPVPVEIALYDDVVTTTRRLRRGEVVTSGDLTVRRQKVDLGAELPVTDLADVVGRRTTLSLPAGRMLSRSAIEELPLVERGDRVTLRFQRHNLLLTAQGEAIEDGWRGRSVRVKNLSSKKLVTGVAAEVGIVDVAGTASDN